MKNIIIIAQEHPCAGSNPELCQTFTPNGTQVLMNCHWDSEALSPNQITAINQAVQDAYPGAVQWKDASCKYNCHSYAWWWTSSSGNHAWMNGLSDEQGGRNDDKYWEDASYVLANWSNGRRISYNNGDPEGDHSGCLIPSHTGWVYSKWGMGPVMVHWYSDVPYKSSVIKLYRRNII